MSVHESDLTDLERELIAVEPSLIDVESMTSVAPETEPAPTDPD